MSRRNIRKRVARKTKLRYLNEHLAFNGSAQYRVLDEEKERALQELKQEVSRKASMANKRLVRLKANKLTEVPAYKQFINERGGAKFSVKGKTYNQLRKELNEVNRFLNQTTSTVRGARKVLKGIASTVGIKIGSVKNLQNELSAFFNLASMIEQYLNATDKAGYAIGYKKIWEAINNYTTQGKIELTNSRDILEKATEDIAEMLKIEKMDMVDLAESGLASFGWD